MEYQGDLIAMKNIYTSFILFLLFSCMPNEKSYFDAVKTGDAEMIKKFLNQGININATNKKGETALIIAAKKGFVDVIKIIVDNDADLTIGDNNGRIATNWAFGNGNIKTGSYLLEKGADY